MFAKQDPYFFKWKFRVSICNGKILTIFIGMNCNINWDVSGPDFMVSSTKAEINPVR